MSCVRAQRAVGFTLVELLVVLAILASLAAVAVRSVAGLQDRARFEASQRALREAESAVLGVTATALERYQPGFLSDLGRLPAVSGDPLRPLLELWVKPASVPGNHLETDPTDGEVTLAVGWRGPYLQLPPGSDRLLDGFGPPLRVTTDATRWLLSSLGADGQVGGAEYDTDLHATLRDTAAAIDRTRSEIAGAVSVLASPGIPGTWQVTVFLYGPDPGTGHLLARSEDPDTESPDLTQYPVVFRYRFTGTNATTPGQRLLRAYAHASGSASETDPRTIAVRRSAPTTITLIAGAQTVDFVVP